MEKMIATTRRTIGLRLPSVMPGTGLVWLMLALVLTAAVAAHAAGQNQRGHRRDGPPAAPAFSVRSYPVHGLDPHRASPKAGSIPLHQE